MKRVWRFFVGDDGKWRWQLLGPDQTILGTSVACFEDYDACIAAARSAGYVFQPAQPPSSRSSTTRITRREWNQRSAP